MNWNKLKGKTIEDVFFVRADKDWKSPDDSDALYALDISFQDGSSIRIDNTGKQTVKGESRFSFIYFGERKDNS